MTIATVYQGFYSVSETQQAKGMWDSYNNKAIYGMVIALKNLTK
jgi:hypothetical protein